VWFRRGETHEPKRRKQRKSETPRNKRKIENRMTLPGWANHDGRDRFHWVQAGAQPPTSMKNNRFFILFVVFTRQNARFRQYYRELGRPGGGGLQEREYLSYILYPISSIHN